MIAENSFYHHLFKGIDNFLETTPNDCVDSFLSHCSKHCSESYSKKVFVDNIKINEPIEESLERLKQVFAGFSYSVDPGKLTILLNQCGCDLVNDNLMHNPKLCICSEKSLLLNWEAVFGETNVKVKKIKTILEGNKVCEFEVKIKQLGHRL